MLDYHQVRRRLEAARCASLAPAGRRPAAVLLPLFRQQGRDFVLFTRRTQDVRHHRGEISFPGGGREAGDADLLETALRETEEELGIAPADVEVLGRLDDFCSVHGYHVTPFVGRIASADGLRTDPGEIAEVIELSIEELCDPVIFRTEDWNHRGRAHPVHFFSIGPHEVWGLTAAILLQFLRRAGLIDRR